MTFDKDKTATFTIEDAVININKDVLRHFIDTDDFDL